MLIVAQKLKELRLENNLTQQNVADILQVSRVVYNRYENNQRDISLELLCKLADYYNVTLDFFAGRENWPY